MPSLRPVQSTPFVAVISTFSGRTPRCTYRSAQAIPAAPAPATTTFTSSICRLVSSSAFRNAAPLMIAVPCWSSWKTGISISAISRSSISKHSGARMSSRLIPPKVGSSSFTVRITSSAFSVPSSMSNTSMPAKRLKRTPLPSITGLPASAPMLPSSSTAVPVVTTATRFAREVYLNASSGRFWISRHGSATPGVYAIERSRAVSTLLVATTSIFPGRPLRWYSSACSLVITAFPLAWLLGEQRQRGLASPPRDLVRRLRAAPLVGLDRVDALALLDDAAVAVPHEAPRHGARERREHLVEHLHDLDHEERLARLEMLPLFDERWQVRRLAAVERTAHRRDDLVRRRGGRRREVPRQLARALGVGETLGERDRELVVDAHVEEAGAQPDPWDHEQELEPELEAAVRCLAL